MPRPDYLICLECETEVEDFTWREGEVRRAACEVCGNSDPDAFALPEDFDQDSEDEEEDEEYEDEELVEDYDETEDEEEE
jgi:hypothetical protein